ncbi:suppressor of fused domain protein [Kribbella hippodromi]|uniref:Suppressor of fused domain protein n=1 Tax=Kribbella hippodromi TaxID=434347 RepID=A0ABP4P7Q1_9ACTN
MTGLIEHLEGYLGPIRGGWAQDADGEEMPFQIAWFDQGAGEGVVSFATLGLGRYPLRLPEAGRTIRHELLMLADSETAATGLLPHLVQQVGEQAVRYGRPFLCGEVIGPRGPLLPGSLLEAFYVAMPVYFPDDFAVCESPDGPIVIAWLVPITAGEARYVAFNGWNAFEDRLVEQDPDLTSFSRQSIVL